jgi:ATP-dependent DNA ligase
MLSAGTKIKHDGFRLLVRKEGSRVRCFTRGGHDWADGLPGIVGASRLKPQSFMIDGEAAFIDLTAYPTCRRAHEVTLAAST